MTTANKSARIEVAAALEDPQWDQFLELASGNHHVQTAQWAELKSDSGWQVLRLVIWQGDRIVGGVQILHRLMRFVGRVGYAPHGPVIPDSNTRLYEQLFAELDAVVRAENFAYLMIQPPPGADRAVALLRARGFNPTPLHIAPTATLVIDLRQSPSEWLAAMRSSTRRSIRRSLSSGLTIRVAGEADLPAVYSVLEATGRRQGFTPAPLAYFRRLWRLFAPSGRLVIFVAELQGEMVAVELDIIFGDTVVSKRAGWSGRHSKLNPTKRLIWAALNWAKQHGYKQYDLEGLDRDLASAIVGGDSSTLALGPDAFKLGFGGRVIVLPENHEYVYGRITAWAHRNLWLKFVPARWRSEVTRLLSDQLYKYLGLVGLLLPEIYSQ